MRKIKLEKKDIIIFRWYYCLHKKKKIQEHWQTTGINKNSAKLLGMKPKY